MKRGPADALLELLRESRLDYRCAPQLGRWTATCPLCREMRLSVFEHGRGGRVTVRCELGCDPEAVLRRLREPDHCHACGTRYGHASELAAATDQLLTIARAQQTLLRETIGPVEIDEQPELRLAA